MCTIFGGQGYKPSKIYVDDFLPVESESTEIKIWLSDMALAINRYSKTNKDNRLYSRK